MSQSDESENNDHDVKLNVNWDQRIKCISNTHKHSVNLHSSLKPGKNVKINENITEKKEEIPLLYSVFTFYRDFHSPTCRVLGQTYCNYLMSWTKVNELVNLFIRKEGVITQNTERMWSVGLKICPPEVKVLDTLYWRLMKGSVSVLQTHTHNLSGRVLSSQSFSIFVKKLCELFPSHSTWIPDEGVWHSNINNHCLVG